MLVFLYMTGWRVSEPLAHRKDDLDLEAGTEITRTDDNKGRRDELVPLHGVVVEHLRKIVSFEPVAFPWPHNRRALWEQFAKIQEEAGIRLTCPKEGKHECMDACHLYGFHDFRRALATANAETLTADALPSLMRHQSYTTTQRYIKLANNLKRSAEKLFVPQGLLSGTYGT